MLDVAPLEALRRQRPLIHCVSNLVTANDCANLALAVGASPMMACAPQEMAEITAAASATVLNTGTPDEERFEVCRLCGCEAVRLGHPVVLDPVGVGASPWRLRRTQELLHLWTPSILRVNLGEAQALLAMNSREQGVDSPGPASQRERLYAAVALARSRRTVVLLQGQRTLLPTELPPGYCGEGATKCPGSPGRAACSRSSVGPLPPLPVHGRRRCWPLRFGRSVPPRRRSEPKAGGRGVSTPPS